MFGEEMEKQEKREKKKGVRFDVILCIFVLWLIWKAEAGLTGDSEGA